MNILDENILNSQRQILQSWRVRVYQIGHDVSRKGITDEEIIPFLLGQRRPTFFTRDVGQGAGPSVGLRSWVRWRIVCPPIRR